MPFRFIHTSDWHIGKVFRFVDEARMGVLQAARLDAVTRLGELAGEHGAGHVLVAGDVYDSAELSRRSVNEPIERMRAFRSVQWHLLPGNHDPHRRNGLWDQLVRRRLPPNVRVHCRPQATLIEEGVSVLPAPLLHRRSLVDPTAWMSDAPPGDTLRIGLAHGTVAGFGSDDTPTPNFIAPDRPEKAALVYLALGDWHRQRSVGERCWYSGTPETDRFGAGERGQALLVEITERETPPRVRALDTGRYRWVEHTAKLDGREAVDDLERRLRGLDDPLGNTLVDLRVEGALSLEEFLYFEQRIVETVGAAFAVLRVHREHLYAEPTEADLDRIGPDGFVRRAADELRRRAATDGHTPEGKLAQAALCRLYVEHQKLTAANR